MSIIEIEYMNFEQITNMYSNILAVYDRNYKYNINT